jgi:cell division protein DivIC
MVADFNKKQKGKSQFLFKAGAIALVIIFIALLFADFKIHQKKQQLVSQIDSYQKQIEEIKNRNETLKQEIENADNPEYIEKVAREQQNMQKPGENVVTFVSDKQEQKQEQKPKDFWTNFTGWLSGAENWIKNKF